MACARDGVQCRLSPPARRLHSRRCRWPKRPSRQGSKGRLSSARAPDSQQEGAPLERWPEPWVEAVGARVQMHVQSEWEVPLLDAAVVERAVSCRGGQCGCGSQGTVGRRGHETTLRPIRCRFALDFSCEGVPGGVWLLISRQIALRVFGRRNHDADSAKDHARQRNRSGRRRRPARSPAQEHRLGRGRGLAAIGRLTCLPATAEAEVPGHRAGSSGRAPVRPGMPPGRDSALAGVARAGSAPVATRRSL